MKLRSVQDFDITGKTVLYRSPYDINVKEVNGDLILVDDSRIKATLPTLKYLLDHHCKIVILTYVGRPDGKVDELLRTIPHAQCLSELLGKPVIHLSECIGNRVTDYIAHMNSGELVMLENTRFHVGEIEDDDNFAQELAKNGEVVVFDGFPQAHRVHASVTGIMRHLPSYAGLYFQKEVNALSGIIENPVRPFTVIIGGAKVSDKIEAIENLYDIADIFLVGGGVANVFLKSEGKHLGSSYIEDVYVDEKKGVKKDWVEYAKMIKDKQSSQTGYRSMTNSMQINLQKIQTPYDLLIANAIDKPSEVKTVIDYQVTDVVPEGWFALDIGIQTQKLYGEIIRQSKTVFWNGPMGKNEDPRFAEGSIKMAKAMEDVDGTTIIGGGNTIAVVQQYASPDKFTLLSLAGGATLELIAGKKLPAVEMLRDDN